MKLFQRLITLAVPCATLFAQSAAPNPAGRPAPPSERPAGMLLRVLDRNHDGVLSSDEIAQAPIALTALDLDGDGYLSADELTPMSRSRGRRSMLQFASHIRSRSTADLNLLVALDANHDGEVQPIEMANAVSSLRRLDRNGDGAITPDELNLQPRHQT